MVTKNCLFTSAGDNTNFDSFWINNDMNYDIYVIYYGNNEDNFNKYKSKVNFIEKRKGSKFQNFKYFYDNHKNIIEEYERFFILDDDIEFNVDDINNMFKISREYNLDICGPSYSKDSKIAHGITKHKPDVLLAYTNFVEVNVPLFSKAALVNFMMVYDDSLIGWGIDFLYIWCNGIDKSESYAIIHNIKCINPKEDAKQNKTRELILTENFVSRAKIWRSFAEKINCPSLFYAREYDSIDINGNNIEKNKKINVEEINTRGWIYRKRERGRGNGRQGRGNGRQGRGRGNGRQGRGNGRQGREYNLTNN